jgi:hypothetical protein
MLLNPLIAIHSNTNRQPTNIPKASPGEQLLLLLLLAIPAAAAALGGRTAGMLLSQQQSPC